MLTSSEIDPDKLLDLVLRDDALYIDNSFLEGFTTCPRALEYNRIRKRVRSGGKAALNFGSAIHLGLEYRYKNYGHSQPDPLLLEEQTKIFSEFFEKNPPDEGDYRTLNWAIEVMRRYNDRYDVEEFQLMQDETGKVLVELPFALPLYVHTTSYGRKIPVIYTGRIDLPVMWNGSIDIIDHKTTSMLGSQFTIGAQMSAQQRGYAWAYQTLTGQKVNGYTINAIRVKEPPIYMTDPNATRKGKSNPETWWNESLTRIRFPVIPGMLEEWHMNTIALVNSFFFELHNNYMPMKTAWCNKYGQCQFFEVCNMAREDRGVMLATGMYMDNHWDPLKDPVTGLLNP